MKCPKCGSAFKHLVISISPKYGGTVLKNQRVSEQIEADQCLSCTGVWFTAEALDEYAKEEIFLIHSKKVAMSGHYYKEAGICPKCEKPMVQIPYKSVVVDQCLNCHGVWVDGGLLDRVERKDISFMERMHMGIDLYIENFKKGDL